MGSLSAVSTKNGLREFHLLKTILRTKNILGRYKGERERERERKKERDVMGEGGDVNE